MLVLTGSSSVSKQKRDILLKNIQIPCPSITSVDGVWVHIVKCTSKNAEAELSDPLSPSRKVLENLLDYGDNTTLPSTLEGIKNAQKNVVYVLPRLGSISPWSSKATDISAICNLSGQVERIERGIAYIFNTSDSSILTSEIISTFSHFIHDRMTQNICLSLPSEDSLFSRAPPRPLRTVDITSSSAKSAEEIFTEANKDLGLALSSDEIAYLVSAFISGHNPINRNPTDAELFMFAQVNSEHCRHKIFNAKWTLNSTEQDLSLFQMIRNTERLAGANTISAYSDNAAVFEGLDSPRFSVSKANEPGRPFQHVYQTSLSPEPTPILIKVETHNHPTGVSPYPGAATGSGGEIRDEGATGRGSKPKAGLAGYTTSNLLIPGYTQPWEEDFGKPVHIASALDIMLEAPLGASAFNNEFGRPALAGYFRTFCERVPVDGKEKEIRGYHKPIMIAGGYGTVRPVFAKKMRITPGAKIVVLGGPGMLIGLGGGAASSQVSGASSAELDFASVQRDNAEMQRRCQQVIDACVGGGENENPIESIHDVGAGGLSNALPELVHDSGLGATFEIRDVLVADHSMSPMEIWCNESQERYVLAISPSKLAAFEEICKRERCPFAVVGVATKKEELVVTDRLLGDEVIRLDMEVLFGKPPRMGRKDSTRTWGSEDSFDTMNLTKYLPTSPSSSLSTADLLEEATSRILRLPSVASKSFLITIGDRTITGLVTRDQMVGPYQVPVSDVAVTRSSYGFSVLAGEAMAMGERTPLALVSPAASARIAVGEALTNLAAAYIGELGLGRVKLSANWMCAAGKEGEGMGLYEAVKAVGMELCPALGVGIPVGKDSMSMSMKWREGEKEKSVSSPLSLIITAFGSVQDVRRTWTPELRGSVGEGTVLVLLDLAGGKQRIGGSALAQVFREIGKDAPDVDDASVLKAFFNATQSIRANHSEVVLAYHDRSDGGLFTTLAEMAFAGRVGVQVSLDALGQKATDPIKALFNEELGAVVQVKQSDLQKLMTAFVEAGFPSTSIHVVGKVNEDAQDQSFTIIHDSQVIFSSTRAELQEIWSETSFKMQEIRDDPVCAEEEFSLISDREHSGLFYDLTFTPEVSRSLTQRPKVAILREQGVNGQIEMAWAFSSAGFDAVDVHMSDILTGTVSLSSFRGLAACGGFSYGDVLGAGKGWAHSVLLNPRARKEFAEFFEREETFALAVCNGCQFVSHLRGMIPGAKDWPEFKVNRSERFEARVSMVEVVECEETRKSVFLREMVGSKLPVAVAHGEGRASFEDEKQMQRVKEQGMVAVRYVDSKGKPTEKYPLNPNGSVEGITGVQTPDGRVLALMPHPERVATLESNSWFPPEWRKNGWGQDGIGPWSKIFQSARAWCG